MASENSSHNPLWTWAVPLVSWAFLLLYVLAPGMPGVVVLLCMGLLGGVVAHYFYLLIA